jgi:hypothetical protein
MVASILQLRQKAGISQELLAYSAQVSRSRLGSAERGLLRLSSEEETRLRRALRDLVRQRAADFTAELLGVE